MGMRKAILAFLLKATVAGPASGCDRYRVPWPISDYCSLEWWWWVPQRGLPELSPRPLHQGEGPRVRSPWPRSAQASQVRAWGTIPMAARDSPRDPESRAAIRPGHGFGSRSQVRTPGLHVACAPRPHWLRDVAVEPPAAELPIDSEYRTL
jgi:hypothetical protein